MNMRGLQVKVVQEGHCITDPKTNVAYTVSAGCAVNDGAGRLYCTREDYEAMKRAADNASTHFVDVKGGIEMMVATEKAPAYACITQSGFFALKSRAAKEIGLGCFAGREGQSIHQHDWQKSFGKMGNSPSRARTFLEERSGNYRTGGSESPAKGADRDRMQ